MSLARHHRDRILAAKTAASPDMGGGLVVTLDDNASPADRAQATIAMRLTHDLRRLKEIQSIQLKIAAKREMLPEYRSWIMGLLEAAEETGQGVQDEVLPTIMVWLIDTGNFHDAMPLIEYVLRHDIALPARYARSAPALITEEIATAALKSQLANESFDFEILARIEALTDGCDMHDEIRAKLQKAIGFELADRAEALDKADPALPAAAARALVPLRRAQQLHDRAGAKDKIKRLEKLLLPPSNND